MTALARTAALRRSLPATSVFTSSHHRRQYGTYDRSGFRKQVLVAAGCTLAVSGLGLLEYYRRHLPAVHAEATAGKHNSKLPTFRRADISKHKSKADGIWVTFGSGVYDITQFSEGHPGGKKILLAAGGDLAPFWEMYAVHKKAEVFEMLEELRIGNVHPDDLKGFAKTTSGDPYSGDPERHPALTVNSSKPFNAEPPPELLIDNVITPNELFFVRNHLPVPSIDNKKWRLEVKTPGAGTQRFSLDDLKSGRKLKVVTVNATIQCAGNRRAEMSAAKPVKGLRWGFSAISNAEWRGVLLSDLLTSLGVKEEPGSHVILQGLDKDMEGVPYEASINAETAFDPRKDVLLAFEMNGQPLPRDHGGPLRAVVPGVVGARQVKWLGKIEVSKEESSSHWQQNDYKQFNPSIDWSNADFSTVEAIQEYPIQSAICEPLNGETLETQDSVTVKGYAWSGGGRGIVRVDVSIDGGTTWHAAKLCGVPQARHRQWAWSLWQAEIPLGAEHRGRKLDITCKAVDTSHNGQPESYKAVWNLRGLINNAWQHVVVNVAP